jgi:hypothetical protein
LLATDQASGTNIMSNLTRQKVWQRQWHEILNSYPDPDGGASRTPDPLPSLDCDFRLHFNMWLVPPEARQHAFAVFPCGEEMLARVDQHLSAPRKPLAPEQAVSLLQAGIKLARDAGVDDLPAPEMTIDVLSEADMPLLEAFRQADDPFADLRDQLSAKARQHHGEAGEDAFFFLSEPLYRLRSSYHVRDWVLWPLCSDPAAPDLTEAGYLLGEGGWSPGWTGETLFIFDRREEFGLG